MSPLSETAVWRTVARGVLLTFGLLVVLFVARELQAVIIQLLLAVIMAAAATPLVDALVESGRTRKWRWRPGRALAAILVFLAAVAMFVGGVILVAGTVSPDLRRLAQNLPRYFQQAQAAITELESRYPDLPHQVAGLQMQDLVSGAAGLLSQAPMLVGFATGALGWLLRAVLTLVLALYLTVDGERIRRYVIEFLPLDRHEQATRVSQRIGSRLGAWARGEIVLGVIVGTMTGVGAMLIGLPYAGTLALVAAVGELVPNLGPVVAAVPLVTVGFLTSPTQGLLALALAVLVQQLENNLIVPRVLGQAVHLPPLVVMVAILAGSELLGVAGALLAVPVAASLAVIVDEIRHARLLSHGPSESPEPGLSS
ncbi:MAG: hypothetical protein HW416_2078 [Chloroflexi bacterium]|nr:hypothetical protein [Chloroflexota bacterium]